MMIRLMTTQLEPVDLPTVAALRPERKVGLLKSMRRAMKRILVAIACAVLPRLYTAYMRFVWMTSRVEDHGISRLHELTEEHDGMVCALWHDEVFSVAWS